MITTITSIIITTTTAIIIIVIIIVMITTVTIDGGAKAGVFALRAASWGKARSAAWLIKL